MGGRRQRKRPAGRLSAVDFFNRPASSGTSGSAVVGPSAADGDRFDDDDPVVFPMSAAPDPVGQAVEDLSQVCVGAVAATGEQSAQDMDSSSSDGEVANVTDLSSASPTEPLLHRPARVKTSDLPAVSLLNQLLHSHESLIDKLPGWEATSLAKLKHYSFSEWSGLLSRCRVASGSAQFVALAEMVRAKLHFHSSFDAAVAAAHAAYDAMLADNASYAAARTAAAAAIAAIDTDHALPPIDALNRLTSDRPDGFDEGDCPSLQPGQRKELLDNDFEDWRDVVSTLSMEWGDSAFKEVVAVVRHELEINPTGQQQTGQQQSEAPVGQGLGADDSSDTSSQAGSDEEQQELGLRCPRLQCAQLFTGAQQKINLSKHLNQHCVLRDEAWDYPDLSRLRKMGIIQCRGCDKYMSARYYRQTHVEKCMPKQVDPEAHEDDDYGKHGQECPEHVLACFPEELVDWFESLPDEEVLFYKHASSTITVPAGCKERWAEAFMLPLSMWQQGHHWHSLKMHFLLLRILAAPVFKQKPTDKVSITKVMRHRLDRLFNGEMAALWLESNADAPLFSRPVLTGDQLQQSRNKKATHYALNGQYRDAHTVLSGSSLMQFTEPVVEQMDELFTPRHCPEHYSSPLDIEESNKYDFEMGTVFVQTRNPAEGKPMMEVPAFEYVMDHLPRYKAADQVGGRYEHYASMPKALVREYCDAALHNKFSGQMARAWRSGLLYAGDKQKKDEKGRPVARPIVVGMALRRICGRIPCAQYRSDFAKLFKQIRQYGVAIPAGVDVAYSMVKSTIEWMESNMDGEEEAPVALQWDWVHAFPNIWRSQVFQNVEAYMPTLLPYTLQCYDGPGDIIALQSGQVVKKWECLDGVWQGDPLGCHHMCFGLYTFMQHAMQQFQPSSVFTDRDSSSMVSIADDFTQVARRHNVVQVATWVLENAPKYGIVVSLDKWCVYAPLTSTEAGLPQDLVDQLAELGAKTISTQGFDRLLGVPLGKSSIMIKPGGQLDKVTTKSIQFIEQISNLTSVRAQFGLLLYSASSTLKHLPRLLPPIITAGYTIKQRDSLMKAVSSMLTLKDLTEQQRTQISLPTSEAGLGLVTAADVIDSTYVGTHAAVARFYHNNKTSIPEWSQFMELLKGNSSLRIAVDNINSAVQEHPTEVKCPHLDMEMPHLWPKQHALASVHHHLQANQLEEELLQHSAKLASWFASARQSFSGSFLRAPSHLHHYRVPDSLFRLQLQMRLLAPIPELTEMKHRCVCGYRGPDIDNGVHFISSCPAVSMVTARHNNVSKIFVQMLQQTNFEVRDKENAGWIKTKPHIRPFDVLYRKSAKDPWVGIDIGIADPTRTALVPAGQQYFKKGKSSSRMAAKKRSAFSLILKKHGHLAMHVHYKPAILEATGSLGWTAREVFKSIVSEAQAQQLGPPKGQSTWSAMTFAEHWMQRISFSISKDNAKAVANGIQQISKKTISDWATQ